MRRREFITLLGGVAAAWPYAARAQYSGLPRIGVLQLGAADLRSEAFKRGLHELGYVEGGNITIEWRFAADQEREAIKGVPRDENTIFQNGKRIGEVVGVRIDPPNNSVVFDRMTIAGHLDQASQVEFKDLVLAFVGLDGFSQTRQGRTLVNAQFSIVGIRRD